MRYTRGRLVSEGRSLDFYYLPWRTSIVSVPIRSCDMKVRNKARSRDMQPIIMDVDVIFKIVNPRGAAATIDFRLDMRTGGYMKDPIGEMKHRIGSIIGDLMRDEIGAMTTEEALASARSISRKVQVRMRHERVVLAMGVHVSKISPASIETSPEAEKAIEALHLEKYVISAKMMTNNGMMMASRSTVGEEFHEDDNQDITPMDCTENCPFSHMCSDYMRNMSNGKARCSLFREFST